MNDKPRRSGREFNPRFNGFTGASLNAGSDDRLEGRGGPPNVDMQPSAISD
jgi:hypothetical protein